VQRPTTVGRVCYRVQVRRYAEALTGREGLPVTAWLVALRSGEWVPVPVVGSD